MVEQSHSHLSASLYLNRAFSLINWADFIPPTLKTSVFGLNFSRFPGWFARVEKKALRVGDYTIAGLENICAVDRKDLADLVHSFTVDRPAFINRLRLISSFPHRLWVISAALSQVKSSYAHSNINPNRILQSLIAVLAGLDILVLCTETHELGEEFVASYLYQIHLYDWLETNDYGRFLVDNDL